MYCLSVNVYYCYQVSAQLQLNTSYNIISIRALDIDGILAELLEHRGGGGDGRGEEEDEEEETLSHLRRQ